MKKTLLLVFIHGFKGSDHTFHSFPADLCALLKHTLPRIDVVSLQYPQYETRGDLKECVARFKEWLQNKVIDLEVANGTPSPTIDPSVHVVLCGHSMGGIVAAETLLSVARDEPVPSSYANDTTNNSTTRPTSSSKKPTNLSPPSPKKERSSSAPPAEPSRFFFPHIQGIVAFDTPYLGISPGVLAHGAEEHLNQASSAYKAFDTASEMFGWKSPRSASPSPVVDASTRGLPAPNTNNTVWNKWGKYAAFGGAAAAIAGAAGAVYLNRNQISQGFAWAGSHLEFVGCLARGAELQKRVEDIVDLTQGQHLGFTIFYAALGQKVTSQTKYAGSMLGTDRTFCNIPNTAKVSGNPTGTKRSAPAPKQPPPKRRKSKSDVSTEVEEGEQVQEYAQDTTKSKGHWIKCVNEAAQDELKAHTSMFSPPNNPGYHGMVPAARDQIVQWMDQSWYESSETEPKQDEEDTMGGADESMSSDTDA